MDRIVRKPITLVNERIVKFQFAQKIGVLQAEKVWGSESCRVRTGRKSRFPGMTGKNGKGNDKCLRGLPSTSVIFLYIDSDSALKSHVQPKLAPAWALCRCDARVRGRHLGSVSTQRRRLMSEGRVGSR